MKKIINWGKITEIEKEISGGNPKHLHEFIDILSEKKLLTKYMVSAICDATYDYKNKSIVWDLLHEFANKI